MVYRTKVDNGYVGSFLIGFLFIGMMLWFSVTAGLWLAAIFMGGMFLCILIFTVPIFFHNQLILEEGGLRIQVGWYVNRLIDYSAVYALQRVQENADKSYSFSAHKVALYMWKDEEKTEPEVCTISPKDQDEFITEFLAKTGIEETPPTPEYQEIFDIYNENTTDAQRLAARRRLFHNVSHGYGEEILKAETPEEFAERQRFLLEKWEEQQERKKVSAEATIKKKRKWAERIYGKRLRRKEKLKVQNKRKPGEEWLDE